MQLIQAINTSADHLSRLNSTLALITRIENQQFTGRKEINLAQLMDAKLEMFQELIALRDISVVRTFADKEQIIIMDQGLADILVTNVLKNAIVHNVDGGKIVLEIRDRSFIISNDGAPLSFSEKELFKRFTRDTKKTGNFGLGLSIVKKICDYYGFKISYETQNQLHIFKIQFPDNSV